MTIERIKGCIRLRNVRQNLSHGCYRPGPKDQKGVHLRRALSDNRFTISQAPLSKNITWILTLQYHRILSRYMDS